MELGSALYGGLLKNGLEMRFWRLSEAFLKRNGRLCVLVLRKYTLHLENASVWRFFLSRLLASLIFAERSCNTSGIEIAVEKVILKIPSSVR